MTTDALTTTICTDCGTTHHSYLFGSGKCLRCTERWSDVETAWSEALWMDWSNLDTIAAWADQHPTDDELEALVDLFGPLWTPVPVLEHS